MTRRHYVSLAVALATLIGGPAGAQTVSVPGDFASLSLALQGINGTNGTPDVINITTDTLSEPSGIAINGLGILTGSFPNITDNVTINGNADANANRCQIDLGAAVTGFPDTNVRFAIYMAPAQTITIRDLVLIPTFVTPTGTSTELEEACINVEEGVSANFQGNVLNIENVYITGSLPGNVPMDPNSPTPLGGVLFGANTGSHLVLNSSSDTSGGLVANITGCDFIHGLADDGGVGIYTDGGIVNLTDCRSERHSSLDLPAMQFLGNGYILSRPLNTPVNMTRCTGSHNDGWGMRISRVNAGTSVTVNINEGCEFSDNGSHGIMHAGENTTTGDRPCRVTMAGTLAEPILIQRNGGAGYVNGRGPDQVTRRDGALVSASNVIFTDNGLAGVHFESTDFELHSPVFNHCLFANNGAAAAPPANLVGGPVYGTYSHVLVTDPNTAPVSITFNDCTFDDVTSSTAAGDPFLLGPTAVAVPVLGSDNFTLNFSNCIISGTTTETGFDLRNGIGTVVNLNDSAVALIGPDAVNSLNATGAGTINQTNVTNDSPIYVGTSTNPIDADSFDVDNPAYAGQGPSGGNLTGWGDYIGGFVQTSVRSEIWSLYQ